MGVPKPCDQITDAGWCPVLRVAHPAEICKTCPHYAGDRGKPPPGLGDLVEAAIDRVTFGAAKAIADKVARLAGKKDCGCKKRKDRLNRLGERIRGGGNGDKKE